VGENKLWSGVRINCRGERENKMRISSGRWARINCGGGGEHKMRRVGEKVLLGG
jgi:hypothetical protein